MKTALCALLAPTLLGAVLVAVPPPAAADGPALRGVAATAATAPAALRRTGHPIKKFHVRPSDEPELAQGWRTWKARDHQRYTTVVERSCFCLPVPPTRTAVRRGRVTSVSYQGEKGEIDERGYEMDALYRQLRRAYRTAATVDVRYRRGVPVRAFIDGDELIADDELGLRVRVVDTDPPEPFAYAVTPFRLRRSDGEELRESWRAWRTSGLEAYVVTTTRQGGEGTSSTLRTYVDAPIVRDVKVVGGGEAPRRGYEVERLYRMIRSLHRTADSVRVRYDEQGVPRLISADPVAEAVDDEFVLRVRLRGA